MRFSNSIRLLMENFRQVYKLFVCKAFTVLVFLALCSVFILPGLSTIIENQATQLLWENFKNIFLAFVDSSLDRPSVYVEAVFGKDGCMAIFLKYLSTLRVEIILVCVACVVAYLLKCFVDETVHFAIGSSMKDKMETYMEPRFVPIYVANFGKACAYAGGYIPISFLADVISFLLVGLSLRFVGVMPFLSLFLSMTLLVVSQALKLTLTGHWLPAMTTGNKRLRDAIIPQDKQERKQFSKVFALYLVSVYLVVIVNVVAAVCTLGSALLVTIPASYFLFICEQYVIYYTIKGKKYFITYETIASNPDHGDRAHFFDYISEAEIKKEENEEK